MPLIKVILVIDISMGTFMYRILIIFVDIDNDISGISISSASMVQPVRVAKKR